MIQPVLTQPPAATFLARIKKAVPERNSQVKAFEQYDAALPHEATTRWRHMVEAWEADRSQPNPFQLKRPSEYTFSCLFRHAHFCPSRPSNHAGCN